MDIKQLRDSLIANIEDQLSENNIDKETYMLLEEFIDYVVMPKVAQLTTPKGKK